MPAKQQFDPRRAKPGQALSTVDAQGKEITVRADDEGVLRPSSEVEKRLADRFGLPVARSVKQAEKDSAGDGGKDKD